MFSHAFNFFRIDPDLRRLEQSPILSSIRNVEMVYFCDLLLVKAYPSFGVDAFCTEIARRAARAIEVLSGAPMLRSVIVSFIDSTSTGCWAQKADILGTLKKLSESRPVRLRIGQIIGPEGDDLVAFLEATEKALDIVSNPGLSYDGEDDDPSPDYRLLAFDVRQQRNNISSRSGFQRTISGRSGWTSAPPSMEVHPEETDVPNDHQGLPEEN